MTTLSDPFALSDVPLVRDMPALAADLGTDPHALLLLAASASVCCWPRASVTVFSERVPLNLLVGLVTDDPAATRRALRETFAFTKLGDPNALVLRSFFDNIDDVFPGLVSVHRGENARLSAVFAMTAEQAGELGDHLDFDGLTTRLVWADAPVPADTAADTPASPPRLDVRCDTGDLDATRGAEIEYARDVRDRGDDHARNTVVLAAVHAGWRVAYHDYPCTPKTVVLADYLWARAVMARSDQASPLPAAHPITSIG